MDECAKDTGLCPAGQHRMNLLGFYGCLPDCGPGFQMAADRAGCEGDRGTVWGCPDSWEPSSCQDSAEGVLCVPGKLGLRGNWHSLDRRSTARPGRAPELGSRGPSADVAWLLATGVPLTRVSFLGLRLVICLMKGDQVRDQDKATICYICCHFSRFPTWVMAQPRDSL